jgi:tripartite-type tricarboxylate transporter receptor subunit TctC
MIESGRFAGILPMKFIRVLWLCASVIVCSHAAAQSYPEKPIRLIVPFAAGAAADMMGRLIAQKLGEAWGEQVIVDNRGGAGTVIGTDMVAKAAPDGYTLLLVTPTFIINATGIRTLPYDTIRSFAPVALFASTPLVLVVHPSLPVRSVKELIALAKSRPGQINYASAGNGSPTHLGMELFRLAGVTMSHIPYKGAAPALTDVLGGQVQLMLTSVIAVQPHIKTGRVRALAVTTSRRSAVLPDVPTIAETLPGYEVVNWWGVVAPGATPSAVVSKLNAEMTRMLAQSEVRERLAREGAEPAGGKPEEFAAFIRRDIAKWTKVVRETGAKID